MTDIIHISSNSKMVEIDLKNPETPTAEDIYRTAQEAVEEFRKAWNKLQNYRECTYKAYPFEDSFEDMNEKINNWCNASNDTLEELIEEEESANRVCINDIAGDAPLKKVTIKEFIDKYNKELEKLFSDDMVTSDASHIYGYPIHIIWNGYTVNIGDGAIPTNALIPALEEMDSEWDGEL